MGQAPAGPQGNKTWLWIALGCLGMIVIGCVGTGVAMYLGLLNMGEKFNEIGEQVGHRTPVITAFQTVEQWCSSGDCKAAENSFHESVRDELMPRAKEITPGVINAMADFSRTEASGLSNDADVDRATSEGLDPTQCAQITGQGAHVVVCTSAAGPQILRMDGLDGLK